MSMKEKIKSLAKKFHPEIISCRRHLHQHPELSFHEFNTQKFVEEKLKEFGITNLQRMANTGIVGFLSGAKTPFPSGRPGDGPCIALRADMDALPILETNKVEYKSTNNGVMHACGHDAHTSSLLGVAKILSELKNEFDGT